MFTKQARDISRGIAKGGLYIAGGVAIGYPLIRMASELWKGSTIENAANMGVWEATGYSPGEHALNQAQTRSAVIRTLIGCGAIYVAKKL